ncbi:MAG TPA: hypothetical protein VK176_07365 [Phycisphaerales bacterium]|nr:hypothetical protein [Phycisphaerales bacterium]
MKMRAMAGVAAAMGLASTAMAGVTPVAEFNGTLSEGFEAISMPGGYPGPMSIFGGQATLVDTLANFHVITFVWSGPAGDLLPYNGNLMGGCVAGSTLFTFATPVAQFGGYLSTVGTQGGGTVIFRDVNGDEIDTLSLDITPTQWTWNGWSSTTPIGSIEVIGANIPMVSTQFDDLQVTFVPAPGAGLLAGAGLIAAGRRRR